MIKKLSKYKETIFLIFLLLIGLFLRTYRLETLMTYLGDEGRDMLVVLQILKGENLPLIGPPTSIGNLYLGPIYYYFITPFAWVYNLNPVGPAIFVALLGTATIMLVYKAAEVFYDKKTAFFASLLYAFSPLIIKFSRSSWNPNPMPFFTLLFFLSWHWFSKKQKGKYLILAAFCFAVMLQLHYMAIVLTPLIILFFFKFKKIILKEKKYLILSLATLFILMLPVIVFDFVHQFINTRGVLEIFQSRASTGFSFYDVISRSRDRIRQLFGLFFNYKEREVRNNFFVFLFLIVSIIDLFKKKSMEKRLIFYSWFIWGFVAVGFYQGSFYPHYMGFLFPLPAILAGFSLASLCKKKITRIFCGLLLLILFYSQVKEVLYSLTRSAVLNVEQVRQVVKLIDKESQKRPFNFALLAKNNYDPSYRYFFKLYKIPAVFEQEVTNQLFVVCEDEDICHPEGNPKWEIALFDAAYSGEIKKAGQWQPDPLLKVFKFVPKE